MKGLVKPIRIFLLELVYTYESIPIIGKLMISVILYGRNDSHGHNLHKRMAISINCIAEVLEDKHDEILFVDYNTPNYLSTVIEDIKDTLTSKAIKRLRIFRVRPETHKMLLGDKATHLNVIEPLARNVALRRSNPKNKWILSANTDMVFVSKSAKSLTRIVSSLDPKYHYQIPRFEIPEFLWNLQDRKLPKTIMKNFYFYGHRFYINHIAYHRDGLYDNPGDFQLVSRDVMFKIGGFDEDMILGWHVDSNLIKRLDLFGVKIKPLFPMLYGYHCNHTKGFSIMHDSKTKRPNCFYKYIYSVKTPYLPKQAQVWGCANKLIEEFNLSRNDTCEILQRILKVSKSESITSSLAESYISDTNLNTVPYNYYHLVPYLMDYLLTENKHKHIGYVGYNESFMKSIKAAIKLMKFTQPLEVFNNTNLLQAKDVQLFVVDCGTTSKKIYVRSLFKLISKVCKLNTTFIFIGAHQSIYEAFINNYFSFNTSSSVSNCILARLVKKPKFYEYAQLHWSSIPKKMQGILISYPKAYRLGHSLYKVLKLDRLFSISKNAKKPKDTI